MRTVRCMGLTKCKKNGSLCRIVSVELCVGGAGKVIGLAYYLYTLCMRLYSCVLCRIITHSLAHCCLPYKHTQCCAFQALLWMMVLLIVLLLLLLLMVMMVTVCCLCYI